MENTSLAIIKKNPDNELIKYLKANKYYIAGVLIIIGGTSWYLYL